MGSRKTQTQRKAKVFVDMKEAEILQALETLAKALDLQVRYEKGDFHGGHCRLNHRHGRPADNKPPSLR